MVGQRACAAVEPGLAWSNKYRTVNGVMAS